MPRPPAVRAPRWVWFLPPLLLAFSLLLLDREPEGERTVEASGPPASVRGAPDTADPTGLAGAAARSERVRHGAFSAAVAGPDGAWIRGTVTQSDGSPVSGAQVRLELGPGGAGFRAEVGDVPARLGRTGAEGSFELEAGPGSWRLSVASVGHAVWTADNLRAGDELDIVLTRTVPLSVRVVDPDGLAVDGAALRVTSSFRDLDAPALSESRSDASGRAMLEGLAPGAYYLSARHPRYELYFGALNVPARDAGEVVAGEVVVQLRAGVRLAGIVRTADGAVPDAAAVRIEAFSKGQSLVFELACDADGRFETEACFGTGEAVSLIGSAAGFAEALHRLRIEAEPGDAQEVELMLDGPGSTAVGRAVDTLGHPVAGARVYLTAIGRVARGMDGLTGALAEVTPHAERWRARGVTDGEGRFRVAGLSAARQYVLLLVDRRSAPSLAWVPPSEPGAEVRMGDVELSLAGSLAGTVSDSAGAPRAGELVRATFETVLTADEYGLDVWRPRSWWRPLRTHSGPDGRFRFDGLAPGAYEIEVGGAPAGSWYVTPGAATGPLALQVPVSAEEAQETIRGVVLNEGGEPVPKALVGLFPPGQLAPGHLGRDGANAAVGAGAEPVAMTFTDYRGAFRLRAPQGLYELRASDLRGAYIEHLQPLRLDGETPELELLLAVDERPVEPLFVRVTDPDGSPLAGMDVSLVPPENDYCGCIAFLARTDEFGQVLFEQLSDRAHEIVASDPTGEYRPAQRSGVRAGDYVEVSLGF